ncbi:MAG: histidine phosphatase family protein, partial [Rhodocyclaceae bacterium]|nr:histidine phosphatase family protein [Rhodocyclaceae bacterium]
MSVLTLVRHGQASFAGDRYDALSPRGIEQARALGAWWAERSAGWNTVLQGPRRRHIDTAALILE